MDVGPDLQLQPLTMMKLLLLSVVCATASALVAPQSATRRPATTQLRESFGIDYAEDTYSNQPDLLRGEAEYKQWVNKIKSDNMLNRKYNVIGRVRELNLLKATADAGVLSKLEANGVDLETIEKVLPLAEKFGLLSLAANNQQLLVNGVAPLLVEGAPLLLPLVAGALAVGPAAFYLAAAACGGLEAYLVSTDAELPLIGLNAGVFLGLLLVPLGVISAGVGVALANAKK